MSLSALQSFYLANYGLDLPDNGVWPCRGSHVTDLHQPYPFYALGIKSPQDEQRVGVAFPINILPSVLKELPLKVALREPIEEACVMCPFQEPTLTEPLQAIFLGKELVDISNYALPPRSRPCIPKLGIMTIRDSYINVRNRRLFVEKQRWYVLVASLLTQCTDILSESVLNYYQPDIHDYIIRPSRFKITPSGLK